MLYILFIFYFSNMGSRPNWASFFKKCCGTVVGGVYDVIIPFNFGFIIIRGPVSVFSPALLVINVMTLLPILCILCLKFSVKFPIRTEI